MTPERWRQVEQLFQAALERPGAERGSFLDEECRDDADLRTEVESLLAMAAETAPFLEGAAIEVAARAAARDAAPLEPGQRIGPFSVSARLGAGGMGEVWRARDSALGRDVAIKVLTALHPSDPERRRRFEQEARAAGQINHPNILTVHAVGDHDGSPYLVTELLEGETLQQRLSAGALPRRTAIDIAAQIARGLAAAHERGIVHRDLKPANLFITTDGRVKILDFGLAKLTHAETAIGAHAHSMSGVIVGTAGYMAPEQVRGHTVDHRADLFSLGIVLYEMLAGRRAFTAASAVETMNQVLTTEPPPIDGIDPELWSIVQHCLDKDPRARFQSARDLAFHLESAGSASDVGRTRGGEGITLRRTTAVRLRSWLPWVVTTAAAIVAILGLTRGLRTPAASPAQPETTIAVLPFVDLSPGSDQGYFADGLAEELLNALTRVPALRVTARASSFQFRNEQSDFRAIGRRLSVASVLAGSVRRDARRVRIAVRLVNAEDGFQRWAATYERQLDDVFVVQEEIARSVVAALRIALEEGAASRPSSQTKDADAYTAFLQGRHFYARRGKEDLEKAAASYSKAIALDPGYAAAWVGLAEVHHRQADNGYLPIEEGYRMARREVNRALDIDPRLAYAHAELGWLKRAHDWDWQGADAAYQRALALDPGNLNATIGAAVLAFNLGRLDEAIALDNRAISMDPLNLPPRTNLAIHLYFAGRLEEAAAALNTVLELNPDSPVNHVLLGRILLAQGQIQAAVSEMEREPDPVWRLYGLCLAYHAAGRVKEADAALAAFIKDYKDTMAFQIAETYAFRGRVDQAFEWLDRAFVLRDGGMADVRNNPLLKPLMDDARYATLLRRIGHISGR